MLANLCDASGADIEKLRKARDLIGALIRPSYVLVLVLEGFAFPRIFSRLLKNSEILQRSSA
jgi:hypothetical protein